MRTEPAKLLAQRLAQVVQRLTTERSEPAEPAKTPSDAVRRCPGKR